MFLNIKAIKIALLTVAGMCAAIAVSGAVRWWVTGQLDLWLIAPFVLNALILSSIAMFGKFDRATP